MGVVELLTWCHWGQLLPLWKRTSLSGVCCDEVVLRLVRFVGVFVVSWWWSVCYSVNLLFLLFLPASSLGPWSLSRVQDKWSPFPRCLYILAHLQVLQLMCPCTASVLCGQYHAPLLEVAAVMNQMLCCGGTPKLVLAVMPDRKLAEPVTCVFDCLQVRCRAARTTLLSGDTLKLLVWCMCVHHANHCQHHCQHPSPCCLRRCRCRYLTRSALWSVAQQG